MIIPVKKYNVILEDLHDLAIIAERKDESCITSEKLKKQLNKNIE